MSYKIFRFEVLTREDIDSLKDEFKINSTFPNEIYNYLTKDDGKNLKDGEVMFMYIISCPDEDYGFDVKYTIEGRDEIFKNNIDYFENLEEYEKVGKLKKIYETI